MEQSARRPERVVDDQDYRDRVPVHAVWELTLACNLRCRHCGSRAGKPRPDELTTAECKAVVRSLGRLGTREVTLIGGEAWLRPDWLEIVREIREQGMRCGLQTGALHLKDACLQAAVAAGLSGIGVSVDGTRALHDNIRGVVGSYDMAINALVRARAAGLATSVNTTLCGISLPELEPLQDILVGAGVSHWQVQLAVAMGNAVDNAEMLLQPFQLGELMPELFRLYHRGVDRGMLMSFGNNIGYFGPFEQLWRGEFDERAHWTGCKAGQTGLGIESDGTIKGCPSLATARYASGTVRDTPLEELWREHVRARVDDRRSAVPSSGYCQSCYYADVCEGGCTWTADSLFGRPGDNPYCHHRVLELARQGLRERVKKVRDAPQGAFTTGEFQLVTEVIPGFEALNPCELIPHARSQTTVRLPGELPRLDICRGCDRHVLADEEVCPFCSADIAAARRQFESDSHRRLDLVARLEVLLREDEGSAVQSQDAGEML